MDVPDGYVLMRQGDLGQEFFMIIDGHVRIERNGETVATLHRGDFLGEIALLAEDRRHGHGHDRRPGEHCSSSVAGRSSPVLDVSP